MDPLILAWLAPYLGTIIVLLLKDRSWREKSIAAIGSILVSAIASTIAAWKVIEEGETIRYMLSWVSTLSVDIGVYFDGLSSLMALVVSWLSFLIAVYSYEYMSHEEGQTRYWVFFTFFVGSMMLLVLSNNLITMFIGWEGTGLASYSLIGHWFTDEEERWVGDPGRKALGKPMWFEPSHSGLRALVFTRLGDVGLILGIATIHIVAGTTLFSSISNGEWVVELARGGILVFFLWMLFLGAMAKSAQFPFHEWLVTAMTGPTSVSALIHAATMVKAGVYFFLRFVPFLVAAAHVLEEVFPVGVKEIAAFLQWMAIIGGFTAFMMATMAIVSRELKLILAFSTASQLGYMFLGTASGTLVDGSIGGLFTGFSHLASHAVFKATLFLAAGAVIHAVHSRFIDDMGGLWDKMKITGIAFILASLSLAGLPPFMGFWTKDEIIHLTFSGGMWIPALLSWITAGLTAAYIARAVARVFFGKKKESHAHEPGPVMWMPYLLLGVLSLLLGILWPFIDKDVEETLAHSAGVTAIEVHLAEHLKVPFVMESTLLLALTGLLFTLYMYVVKGAQPHQWVKASPTLSQLHAFLYDRWYINSIYYIVVVDGIKKTSQLLKKYFNDLIVDGFYHRLIPVAVHEMVDVTSRYLEKSWDKLLHEYLVETFRSAWRQFRRLQTGYLSHYIAYMWIGISLLIILYCVLRCVP